jgi:pSer/pThr/pTyr-binding forkhead associated (FHA) protein
MLKALAIFVHGGNNEPLIVELDNELCIGRDDPSPDHAPPPDVDLSPYQAKQKGVSRRHVVIRRQGDVVSVVDLGSPNKTYVNGELVIRGQPRPLHHGDELRLGLLVMYVYFHRENPHVR